MVFNTTFNNISIISWRIGTAHVFLNKKNRGKKTCNLDIHTSITIYVVMTYSGLDIDYLPLVVIGFMYGIVIVTPTNE
jgi:hypothetical protein